MTDDTFNPIPEPTPTQLKYAITVDGTMITGVHEGMEDFTDDTFANSPGFAGQQVIPALPTAEYQTNTDIRAYGEDGKIIDLIDAIGQGYIPMPEGYDIVDGVLIEVEMPAEEAPLTLMAQLKQVAEETAKATSEAFERKFEALKSLISDLLKDREADVVVRLRDFLSEWEPGVYEAGMSVLRNGYPYKVNRPGHDSTANPDWTPENYPALFSPWHGRSPDTALPWVAPKEAESMYRKGEYMLWTEDGLVYLNVEDTDHSPVDYPAAWHIQGEDGTFGPIPEDEPEQPEEPDIPVEPEPEPDTPVDPEEPEEPDTPVDPEPEPEPESPLTPNSNGTARWALYIPYDGTPKSLYGRGDGVTGSDGERYVSLHNNNGNNPVGGVGWWEKVA